MKLLTRTILGSVLTLASLQTAWSQEGLTVPLETKAAIVVLSSPAEAPAAQTPPRLRDSLQSFEHLGGDDAHSYPYRLSVDERRRLREQLRGQAALSKGTEP